MLPQTDTSYPTETAKYVSTDSDAKKHYRRRSFPYNAAPKPAALPSEVKKHDMGEAKEHQVPVFEGPVVRRLEMRATTGSLPDPAKNGFDSPDVRGALRRLDAFRLNSTVETLQELAPPAQEQVAFPSEAPKVDHTKVREARRTLPRFTEFEQDEERRASSRRTLPPKFALPPKHLLKAVDGRLDAVTNRFAGLSLHPPSAALTLSSHPSSSSSAAPPPASFPPPPSIPSLPPPALTPITSPEQATAPDPLLSSDVLLMPHITFQELPKSGPK